MHELFQKKLTECRYSTLKCEFTLLFETNDPRTVERYIGRPPGTVHSTGKARMVRVNRRTGKIGDFDYYNTREVPRKVGLLETLGYMTMIEDVDYVLEGKRLVKKKVWKASLHHERMDYYSEQSTLEAANRVQECESSDLVVLEKKSNDNLCVRSLLVKADNNDAIAKASEVDVKTVERKEEEVIDSTHTNRSSESETQPVCLETYLSPELSSEELATLEVASADSERKATRSKGEQKV